MTTDLEILKGMDALYKERSWCQGFVWAGGESFMDASRYCLQGAARRVICGGAVELPGAYSEGSWVTYIVDKVARAAGADCNGDEWNDEPGRTKGEVVAAIRKAIELEEAA